MADSGTIHMVFWLLVLVFLSFWVAGICLFPFTLVSIFVPCIPDLKGLSDLLLKGVTFPYICSDNMVNKRGFNLMPCFSSYSGFSGEEDCYCVVFFSCSMLVFQLFPAATMANKCVMGFLWFLILILFSFLVACLSFAIFCLIQVFIPCCNCLEPGGELLIKGISFPKYCVEQMISGGDIG